MTAVDDDPAMTAAADLHDAGDLAGAEAAYRTLLAARPGDPAVTIALADVLADAERSADASHLYHLVIDAAPDAPESADAYDGLAAVLQDAGDVDRAVAASRRAVALRGDADDAYRLGYTLEQMNRADDANAAYELAAAFRPGFAEAHAKVGTYLMRRNRPAEAAERYRTAADAGPTIAEIHCNLAQARRLAGDEDGALKSARKAIELKPDLAAAHNVLGSILQDRRRPAEALAAFQRAVSLKPDLVDAYNNIGGIMERIGRPVDAGMAYERAVAMAPTVPQFHANLGMNRLLRGDLTGGWAEFDYRRADRTNPASRTFDGHPLWDGGPLGGRTVLLTAEQGMGDTIQFLRYAPMVANRGGRVIVECHPPLVPLARTVAGVADVVPLADGVALPDFDVHCPLMTLPRVFNTRLDTIPASVPYVSADPAKVAEFAAKLPADGRRVGLAWAGNPAFAHDRARSIAPARLSPLAAAAVQWVSLQKSSATPPPAELKLTDVTADLHDFADTAALIASLDLVVTVDTAVAHLAGAMGKPVWVLLPAVPDWRWMLGRPDSPWYPTARLFRQTEAGDWAGVVQSVVTALMAN